MSMHVFRLQPGVRAAVIVAYTFTAPSRMRDPLARDALNHKGLMRAIFYVRPVYHTHRPRLGLAI